MTPLRVCFAFASFYPAYGGAAIYVQRFIPYLRAAGVESFVCTSAISGRPSRESVDDVDIYRVPIVGRRRLRQLSYQASLVAFLIKHQSQYDIVHFGDGSGSAYPAIPVLKALGKPIVVESTLMGSDDGLAVARQKLGRLKLGVLRQVDAIWGLSDAIGQSYLAVGFSPAKVHVLPYGVDSAIYRPAPEGEKQDLRRKLGVALEAEVAVFVGGINRRKGIDTLIRAFAQARQKNPHAQLLLVGPRNKGNKEGYRDYAVTLDSMISELGITANVHFTGQVDNVVDYLRCADVYIMASHSEGLGLGLLEAMACGLPCVVMELPGITDMIFDADSGYVVQNRDEAAFAQCIIELFHDSSLAARIGQAARRRIERNFEIHQRARKFRELYDSLLKR